jgi:hypothetical protein
MYVFLLKRIDTSPGMRRGSQQALTLSITEALTVCNANPQHARCSTTRQTGANRVMSCSTHTAARTDSSRDSPSIKGNASATRAIRLF